MNLFLIAAAADWIKLAFLMLPILALLYRTLIGDQDEQSRDERRRADQMDRMLDDRRPDAGSRSPSYGSSRGAIEAEVVETRHLSSIRSDRDFSTRVSQDTQPTGGKIQDEIGKKFENRHVGNLGPNAETTQGTDTAAVVVGATVQGSIVEVSALQMRQAFLLREILRRPEF